jgi:LPXTG-motif cell wall-anchored protein
MGKQDIRERRMNSMKKFTSKLLIIAVFALVFVVMVQSANAMGLLPWGNRGGGNGGSGRTTGVPDPVTMLSLLGVGVVGVGGYLLIRKKKDK